MDGSRNPHLHGLPVGDATGEGMGGESPALSAEFVEIGQSLRTIAALGRQFERKLGAALAVNPSGLAAMEHLMVDGPLTPGDLAARLQVTTAAGTQIVDRLEQAGHVHRERQTDDRRRVLVVPAPASVEQAFGELAPLLEGMDAIVGDLTAADRTTIEQFLAKVVALYTEVTGTASGAPASG